MTPFHQPRQSQKGDTLQSNNYRSQFNLANEFVVSLGLSYTRLPAVEGELVTPEYGQKVGKRIQDAGIGSFKHSAVQCLKWSHALRPLVEEAMGCPVVLTLGQLYYHGKAAFNPTREDFAKWYRQGFQIEDFRNRLGFNLHAWYTLPTMEVLDLTLYSSFAAVWNKPELEGMITGGWPDRMASDTPSTQYIPMAVGNAYIEQVSSRSVVPLLATELSQAELDAIPIWFAFDK